jgi:chloramphenicol-sensitive protein RarD
VPGRGARLSPGSAQGIAFALAAAGVWGLSPVYWKALGAHPAPELLAHRVLWSLVVGAAALTLRRGWPQLRGLLADRRTLAAIAVAAALLGVNWLTFIYAVERDRVLETSLGYYVNPLISVALGAAVLRERLRRAQWIAVTIATAGVAQLVAASGRLPWVSLVLATSFALYGLVRKLAVAPPLAGFAMETLLLSPVATAYLCLLGGERTLPAESAAANWLAAGTGLLTAAPLLCFTSAARRLPLATLGIFQYVSPSIGFVLAVGVYGEPFDVAHAVSFGCVWLALALYGGDLARAGRGGPGRALAHAPESTGRRTP